MVTSVAVASETTFGDRAIHAVRRLPQGVIPILIGVVSFFVFTGGRVLDPRNIRWITDGDCMAHFLGWHFFRFTPWTFPIGLNPRFGAELSSGIVFADNIPLCDLVFKVFSRWLSDPFQYFGIWMLGCFVLQAWFGWLLMGLITPAPLARAAGCTLFVFAPPFMYRLNGHYMMATQWLLLAALYMCFGPRTAGRGVRWPLLALMVSLVHTYMTAMVLGLWLTDVVRRVWFEGRLRSEWPQIVAVPCLLVLSYWQTGFFSIHNGVTRFGFGFYRMNVLGLIDSGGWSYVLPDIPGGKGEGMEGFNYLGLGVILLALLALPAVKGALPALRARRHYWPLLVVLVGLTLFSISNVVGVGGSEFEIPVPDSVINRANTLRASGRMFWPVFYVILFVLLRVLFTRYRPRNAAALLCAAVLVQAADTSAGWLPYRADMMPAGPTWPSPLKAAFWKQVPENYSEIRLIAPQNHKDNYEIFSYFAATHGMATDAVYNSRVDQNKLRKAQRDAKDATAHGRYAEKTLYILLDAPYVRAARRSLRGEHDLLRNIDGFWVVAPGWMCREQCRPGAEVEDCSDTCPAR